MKQLSDDEDELSDLDKQTTDDITANPDDPHNANGKVLIAEEKERVKKDREALMKQCGTVLDERAKMADKEDPSMREKLVKEAQATTDKKEKKVYASLIRLQERRVANSKKIQEIIDECEQASYNKKLESDLKDLQDIHRQEKLVQTAEDRLISNTNEHDRGSLCDKLSKVREELKEKCVEDFCEPKMPDQMNDQSNAVQADADLKKLDETVVQRVRIVWADRKKTLEERISKAASLQTKEKDCGLEPSFENVDTETNTENGITEKNNTENKAEEEKKEESSSPREGTSWLVLLVLLAATVIL